MSETATLNRQAASFYFDDGRGWTLVVPGHGHDVADIHALGRIEWGDDALVDAREEWFVLHKRIKWCDRLDGFGCDSCGDWHRHLSPVRSSANEDTRWTVIALKPLGSPASSAPASESGQA